ncbi:TIGR02217 family protein [uncultured Enterovirga sp.]|uniref:phage distal tail protein, Rcc01695 family n=1 Tax=uncultured Enterovirga sp. TaxID=2026352 RepID=UPI0035CB6775
MPTDFHEIRFPLDIALGSRGGPVRRTDIVTLASGREHRNARWANSRRRYDAGLGIRNVDALHAVLVFFEERRGRLIGFRFRDRMDDRSCPPSAEPTATNQLIGTGDGVRTVFPLAKSYGTGATAWHRAIAKPVDGSVRIAVGGVARTTGIGVDATSGLVTFAVPPPPGATVTAGFRFDVPVRFDTDALEIDLAAFQAGQIPSMPLIEILP